MADAAEPALVRHTVRVPAERAEIAAAVLLDAFPGGLEEEDAGDDVLLSGYCPPGDPPALPPPYRVERAERVIPGWREGWRSFHRPVRSGRFWIGPPWLEPDADAEPIVVDPGPAFGTGAHGSTRAAVELLLRLPAGGPLLDLGCGSGVLSILARRLGFGPVTALDVDPDAVRATRDNAAANGVDGIEARVVDVLQGSLPAAATALANLQLDLLGPLFARRPDGLPPVVVASGLLAPERFAPPRWRVDDDAEVDGWRALLLRREP